jgi:Endonuclease/Exonuclease/phosphatase family
MRFLTSLLALLAYPALAEERLRVATFDVALARDGAGVLLRDLSREPDDQIAGIVAILQEVQPDVLLLTGFDYDARGRALDALRALLGDGPSSIDYPHNYNGPVNSGEPSGLDLDGDGMPMGWADNWGWGKFPGHAGMVILSLHPIAAEHVRTFNDFHWRDLPGADLPHHPDGTSWPSTEVAQVRRLASTGAWDVPVMLPSGEALHLLASNPTPPLFDGPEGANVKRNRDELRFWATYLSGQVFPDDQGRAAGPPTAPVILLGNLNTDSHDGAGDASGINALLKSGRLEDVKPVSQGAILAAEVQGGANAFHDGPPALDTADWRDDEGPGNLRVDYVLPDASLTVLGAGVFWPPPDAPLAAETEAASRHRLVWVDVALP